MGILDSLFTVFEQQVFEDITWQERYTCLRVLAKVDEKLKATARHGSDFDKLVNQVTLLNNDDVLA